MPPPRHAKTFQASDNLIWGHHPVLEMIRRQPRQISEIFVIKGDGAKNQDIIDLARGQGLKIKFLKGCTISGAGKARHQGILARLNSTETMDETSFLDMLAATGEPPFVLALDSIQDPHNLGALLRSAAAAGVTGVIVPRDRSAPLSGAAAKVAAGALAHLTICQVTNLASFIKKIKKLGIWVYGTVKEARDNLFNTDLGGPVCLVIGNEEKGIRPLVLAQCDGQLTIPMPGRLDSLNASVAGGIALFEVVRQRQRSLK